MLFKAGRARWLPAGLALVFFVFSVFRGFNASPRSGPAAITEATVSPAQWERHPLPASDGSAGRKRLQSAPPRLIIGHSRVVPTGHRHPVCGRDAGTTRG